MVSVPLPTLKPSNCTMECPVCTNGHQSQTTANYIYLYTETVSVYCFMPGRPSEYNLDNLVRTLYGMPCKLESSSLLRSIGNASRKMLGMICQRARSFLGARFLDAVRLSEESLLY